MPIRSVREIAARRAAQAQAASVREPASATPLKPIVDPDEVQPAPSPPCNKVRGHAVKGADGKWLPTGDYEQGFCKPPVANQFKPGGKGGPGRPKGSVSHATMLRKMFEEKQRARINGRERMVTMRELILISQFKDAVEGKRRDARKYILAELSKLYPDAATDGGSSGPAALSATDQGILNTLLQDLGLPPVQSTPSNDEDDEEKAA